MVQTCSLTAYDMVIIRAQRLTEQLKTTYNSHLGMCAYNRSSNSHKSVCESKNIIDCQDSVKRDTYLKDPYAFLGETELIDVIVMMFWYAAVN